MEKLSTPERPRRDSQLRTPPSPLSSIWQTDWTFGLDGLSVQERGLPTPADSIWHTPTRSAPLGEASPSYRSMGYAYGERVDSFRSAQSLSLGSLPSLERQDRMEPPRYLPPSPPALSPSLHSRTLSYPAMTSPPALQRSNSSRSSNSDHSNLLERLLEKGLTPQQIEGALERLMVDMAPAHTVARSPPRLDRRPSQPLSPRSPILDEYRSKSRKIELLDVVGHVVEFSTDQHGSRFIQQKIESATPQEKQFIFEEASRHTLALTKDVFGNYVVQKLIELSSPAQRRVMVADLRGHVVELSLQMYGCRVVQKAIEFGAPEDQAWLIAELAGHVLLCVRDQNANHVIQKAIEHASPLDVQFVVDGFQGHIKELATHPYGCRVLQRVFEFCPSYQSKPLMDELHHYTTELIQDQFGNYVTQHVLEQGTPQDKHSIISRIQGHVLRFSQHKFASNVVEKCMAQATLLQLQTLVNEVITPTADGIVPLTIMIKDQYANYVVQKMLDVVNASQREQLLQRIIPHVPALRRLNYGKHLITKVDKYNAVQL